MENGPRTFVGMANWPFIGDSLMSIAVANRSQTQSKRTVDDRQKPQNQSKCRSRKRFTTQYTRQQKYNEGDFHDKKTLSSHVVT